MIKPVSRIPSRTRCISCAGLVKCHSRAAPVTVRSGSFVSRKFIMDSNVVMAKQGWIRGNTVRSAIGRTYISFKGIPFAAPPVGDLRFKDPQPPVSWTGIRNAYTHGSKCAQYNVYARKLMGDDDCLYLNVATSSLNGSRPVMVWIHGGAFAAGSGDYDMHSPDYLMESDIVYVSINYRLGVFGFLQLDHEAATGNMGLKDQVAALKWVKENISQFGGDSNNITIFGVSAGSASVHYLLASPLAKGLFHRAIMQSGTAVNTWARVLEPVKIARQFVAVLGKDISDPDEIVEYLRTVPAIELVEAQQKMARTRVGRRDSEDKSLQVFLPFAPTLDDKSAEPFLPKPFEDLVDDGYDVPVIIGYNSHEGAVFLAGIRNEVYAELDENFQAFLPKHFAVEDPVKISEIAKDLRTFYFGDDKITKDSFDNYVQYYGDAFMVWEIHNAVDIQLTKKSPIYLYKLSYGDPTAVAKAAFQVQAKGAIHTEELQYLFFQSMFQNIINIEPGSTHQILRDRFVRMWTDFAKTGNPTPWIDGLITEKWLPATRTSRNYLKIDSDLSIGDDLDRDVVGTWKRVKAIINEH